MKNIVVIGAGIVGTSIAFRLLECGHRVTLVDRAGPGEQCSYGNAGALMGNAHFPSAAMLPKIPGMLVNPDEPLSILWRDFPGMLPWFMRYLRESRPARTHAIASAAAALNGIVQPSMTALLRDIGAPEMLSWNGRLFAYQSEASLKAEEAVFRLKNQAGIEMQLISGDEARDMEPTLGPLVRQAIFTPQAGHVLNPFRLVQLISRQFVERGGLLVRDEVKGFHASGDSLSVNTASGRSLSGDEFVLAAGVWSAKLAGDLGVRLQLIAERGYHAMIARPGVSMRIPTMWNASKIMLTPMEHGIRIAGMSEFGSPDRPPNMDKVRRMLHAARDLVPSLDISAYEPWMGPRPATPDYLPIIGRSTRHPKLVFACGHGHSGLQFGPATADLVCEIVDGRQTRIDISPFGPDRFQ